MSWEDRSPQERRDLRERRSARRERKVRNVAARAEEKRRRILGPVDEAAAEWDAVRLRIQKIKAGVVRDAEWTRLAQMLQAFNVTAGDVHASHSQGVGPDRGFHAQRRAGARGPV